MQTFNLDLSARGVIPLLNAKQRDVGTKICVVLTDNQEAYNIPDSTQFSVWFTGKSGSGNYTEIDGRSAFSIDGNKVTVELIYQMLNNPGEHVMCLVMNDAEGNQQGLWNIPYFVEAIPGADSQAAVQYYQAFLQAQERAEAAAQSAEDAATRIGYSEEYITIKTEQHCNAAINAQHFAEVAQEKAEKAAESAEEAAKRAEDAVANLQEIPEYWETELHAGVEAINSALEGAGRNKSAFLWYHDAHWTNNSKMSPKLLKYLCKHTAMNKVNFGGDIVSTEAADSREDWAYLYDWRNAVKDLPNHHSVRGNHDDDIPGLQTDKALYAFLMAAEETPDIVRGGDFYYYVDDVNEKTRYLYLDTQVGTTLTNQGDPEAVQFVVDALNSTPKDWHIVPIAHIWFLYADWNTPTVGSIPNYCQQLLDVFDTYNARSSGSVTVRDTDISYDFANGVGKVEFCIGGHLHVDYDFTTAGGIPVILTEADEYEWRGGHDATPGTIGESAVSAIIADYDANTIHVIRIGRGESRQVSLENSNGGYTNILEEVGYVADKRLSASGGYTESDQTGVYLTGYIPVNVGDTLYFENMQIPLTFTTGYDQHLYFFDGDKVGYGHDHISNYDNGILTAVWEEVDGTAYLKQFTFKGGSWEGITYTSGYIRLNAAYIDDTSVITINEPIT